MRLLDKIMILKGVKLTIQPLGVGYANKPKKAKMGGYVGLVHNLLIQFFTLDSLKMEVFETCFSDIMTTQNDHPRYVKHVLSRIYVLLTLFAYQVRGGGGGVSSGIGTQPALQLFTPDTSKINVFETRFGDIVTIQNDHARYVKHVLGCIYMFLTLFRY